MTWQRWSPAPVWAGAIVGAVLVGAYAGAAFLTWIPVVLGVLVLATAAIQLAIQRKEGFVTRMILSISGAVAILVAASAVLLVLHPGVPLLTPVD